MTFQYDLTPRLMTCSTSAGAVPNASQLYGSWNLGSATPAASSMPLIGNTDLKTETSDNLEVGG